MLLILCREKDRGAKLIIQMNGTQTTIQNPEAPSELDNAPLGGGLVVLEISMTARWLHSLPNWLWISPECMECFKKCVLKLSCLLDYRLI